MHVSSLAPRRHREKSELIKKQRRESEFHNILYMSLHKTINPWHKKIFSSSVARERFLDGGGGGGAQNGKVVSTSGGLRL